MSKVRMADIAQRVGVSTVTVHNALSGQKGVSDEVRNRILQAADEMGYRQRPAVTVREKGRGLKNIGVIISEKYLADYTTFYWKMYQEMALIATDKNCAVVVEILKHYNEDNLVVPRIVEEHTVEGVIVLGEISREYIRVLKRQTDMPVIFLDFYDKELANDAVIADNFYGMYLMTEYLFARGFRRMAYVGSIHETSSIMDRYCGFYKALLEHGVQLRPEWLIEDRNRIGNIEIVLPECLPEAFVCNCDLTAGLLMMKLEERGIRVPEDISVVGFDNYLYPGFPDKKITSYEVNTGAMAKVALDKVLKQMKNTGRGRGLDVVSGHIVEKQSVRMQGISGSVRHAGE
ncbi:MAG: LacI family DNA-binding transcriptional regulator [Lachnospiraceae bacterium]|nr:LacI family DNA-binding transcriptional regulator [Lachnospiraceae bacterium]